MSFKFVNARTIDEQGNISLDCLVLDDKGVPTMSFPYVVNKEDIFTEAGTAAGEWVKDNPDKVAAYVPPTLDTQKGNSKAQVINILSALVNRVTSNYVATDPLIWPLKEAEALLFQERGGSGHKVSDYPSIAGPFKKLHPEATDTELLVMIAEEVPKVLYNANAFRAIQEFTEAVRMETYPLIEAAEDEQELLQIVADVQTKVEEFSNGS